MKKKIDIILTVLSILIILWFVISYIEIIMNNLDESPEYSAWNFFTLMIDNIN